jgi:hypothetical protein
MSEALQRVVFSKTPADPRTLVPVSACYRSLKAAILHYILYLRLEQEYLPVRPKVPDLEIARYKNF